MGTETIAGFVRDAYAEWRWTPAWTYDGRVTTWRLERDGATRYAKIAPSGAAFSLGREAATMRWAADFVRVPRVVEAGSADGLDWLVTDALPGRTAVDDELRADPNRIVPIVARGLRAFHDALPVADCPFRLTVDAAISICRRRVECGAVAVTELHDEFRPAGVAGTLAALEQLAPNSEDLVVCHGDYCFPNVLIEHGVVTGYVDLSELNVADRWWDVAVGMWSTTWNVGPGYEQLFADSYGIAIDQRKIEFYRRLYSLIS